jgi:hypothetical protein
MFNSDMARCRQAERARRPVFGPKLDPQIASGGEGKTPGGTASMESQRLRQERPLWHLTDHKSFWYYQSSAVYLSSTYTPCLSQSTARRGQDVRSHGVDGVATPQASPAGNFEGKAPGTF